MLDKLFDPQKIEAPLYEKWETSKAFQPQPTGNAPYVIMVPPPNVTGSLHIGHALNGTLQDILIRYHRMKHREVLWQPGTDHAGIATQMVVERQLAEQGLERRTLGREAFLEKVWAWKEESGGMILKQQRRLGLSLDWSRERFTMDEGLTEAVKKVFIQLYNEGLIYRDKRLVNWDPHLLTAVSDLEVKNVEEKGLLYYLKYPLEGREGETITIATTRPETMLGDTAIVVHPKDKRYQHLIGGYALLPLVGRRLPIIGDEHGDPEKGSGAVKITPAHDFNDFEIHQRHQIDILNIFDEHGCFNANVPEAYRGMDRFKAREIILAELKGLGLYEKSEEVVHSKPYGERSGVLLEPRLTDQWFVNAKVLAQPAIQAVKEGRTQILPQQWATTYFHWLENIQPWCISRQLWWGHRIPAWYGPDNHIFVGACEEEALTQARQHYGQDVVLRQDEDVLDTWFSSALWPFSTLGWPEETQDLKKYYPSTVLVTGLDLIFFWVARMMMMGLHFMKDVPFKTVYMHALVRDEKGQKMSKSKGNIIDPLGLIDGYGADAVRFTLAALAAPGRNVNFSKPVLEGYRNFATKVWNAARFCEHYECVYNEAFNPQINQALVNRWIVSELAHVQKDIEEALEEFRFDEVAHLLYQFVWGKYCDWYLEFAKPLLTSEDEDLKQETRQTSIWVLGQICHLLHPLMPFITEELWQHLTQGQQGLLIQSTWPDLKDFRNLEAEESLNWSIRLITEIRAIRAEMNVPAAAFLKLGLLGADEKILKRLQDLQPIILRLARLEEIITSPQDHPLFQKGLAQTLVDQVTLLLPLGDVVDLEEERKRLQKSLRDLEQELLSLEKKLKNPDFVNKAPEDVLQKNKKRYEEAQKAKEKIEEALKRVGEV